LARSNTPPLAWAAFFVVCIVWGTTYLAIRIAVRTIPPLLLTGFRFSVAGFFLLGIARLRGESFPRPKLGELMLVGVLLVCVGNYPVVWAEQWVPSGAAALLVAMAPFWMVLLERLHRGGDRLDARRATGMILGFIGVLMLILPAGSIGGRFDRQFIYGALGIQGACIAWQYGTLRAKYHLQQVPPLMSSATQMLAGGIAVGLLGIATGETRRISFASEGLMALMYLTFVGSLLAYTAYVYAVRFMPTTNMSLYAYINPLVAVLLGWAILHERLSWMSLTAMVIILAGVALVQTKRRIEEPECVPVS
jgi:drug/metabolite transporter (DMT)-like permease